MVSLIEKQGDTIFSVGSNNGAFDFKFYFKFMKSLHSIFNIDKIST